jgi:hypothetical protein
VLYEEGGRKCPVVSSVSREEKREQREGRPRSAWSDKLYWNNFFGSPFYMVPPPSVKGYVGDANFEVHWDTVWLNR